MAAFALVNAAFLGSTVYAELSSVGIDQQASSIITGAIPGIDRLSEARAELRGLQTSLEQYVGGGGTWPYPEDPNANVAHFRAQFAESLEQFRALHRDDAAARAIDESEVRQPLAKLDDEIRRIAAAFARHDEAGAKAILEREAESTIAETFAGLWHLVDCNNAAVHHDVVKIVGLRHHARWLAIALDGLSLCLAVAIGAVALRTIRTYATFMEGHHRLLEERAAELEQFAGRVAHDISNPLSVAQMTANALRRAAEDDKSRTLVGRLERSLERCHRLVEGLLEFARSGARPEPGGRAAVGDVVRDVADAVRSLEENGHPPDLTIEPFAPSSVACSSGALMSVLSNLLLNAVKYTRDCDLRHITLRVVERGGMIRFEVEDTGPGLPAGSEDSIFEPYVRVTHSKQPGVGLGLATVKRLSEGYGGRVGVHSVVGKGCTFWVELPRAAETVAASGAVDAAPHPASG